MIGKAFVFIGFFLVGVSVVGLISFTAYAFPLMRPYGFWLSVVAGMLLVFLAVCDDYFSEALGLNNFQYVALLIAIVLILLIGGVIQWIR